MVVLVDMGETGWENVVRGEWDDRESVIEGEKRLAFQRSLPGALALTGE